jgi:hypothetical protein
MYCNIGRFSIFSRKALPSMSLTWLPGAYGQREAAHKRLSGMEARMKIRPEEQVVFEAHARREEVRRDLRMRMERLAKAIDSERRAVVLTNQKVDKLSAIKRTKRRERKLRKTIMKQLRLRPSTSNSTASSRSSLDSGGGGSLASSRSRRSSSSTPSLGLDGAVLLQQTPSNASSRAPSVTSSRSGNASRCALEKAISQRSPTTDSSKLSGRGKRKSKTNSRRQSRPTTVASSTVSERWLVTEDPQAPFSARRHKLKATGMDYVPMDFAGHADLLRTTDGPARVARYFGRRRDDFNDKLLRARIAKKPAFGRKQTDISRVPEKQAGCSTLKYRDGPAAGDKIRRILPASDVTTFVNFIKNPTPFLRPLGERHHLKLTTLVREREVLHENVSAVGGNAIQQNNGLYGTWY